MEEASRELWGKHVLRGLQKRWTGSVTLASRVP